MIDENGKRFLRKLKHLRFSPIERHDLLKSWFVISLAFTIAIAGFTMSISFVLVMAAAAITVGLGFLLHELAHKAVAVHFGMWAEYRAFDNMLLLSLFASFFGVLFAAPGAVFITGRDEETWLIAADKNGKISAAGPLMNFMLAALFILLTFAFPILSPLTLTGASINAWLGLFNMIPFLNFDGAKIWPWSKTVYGSMILIGVGLMISARLLGNAGIL